MSRLQRLAKLEARTPESEPVPTASPLTPRGIEAAARVVVMRAKEGSASPLLLGLIPALLASEHVPEALKEQLRAL